MPNSIRGGIFFSYRAVDQKYMLLTLNYASI